MAEKKNLPKSTDKEQKTKSNKPPFKLCFSRSTACLGQSNIHPCRPQNYVPYVTRKFYSKFEQQNMKQILPTSDNYILKPKEKYKYPVLESQIYGWFSDVTFQIPKTLKDRILNYRRARNPIFAHSDRVPEIHYK